MVELSILVGVPRSTPYPSADWTDLFGCTRGFVSLCPSFLSEGVGVSGRVAKGLSRGSGVLRGFR